MEINEQEQEQLEDYLGNFNALIGDQRTEKSFVAIIQGIIGSESLCATQIANFSPWNMFCQTR